MLSSHLFFCLLSSSPSCSFHCPLQNCKGQWKLKINTCFLNHSILNVSLKIATIQKINIFSDPSTTYKMILKWYFNHFNFQNAPIVSLIIGTYDYWSLDSFSVLSNPRDLYSVSYMFRWIKLFSCLLKKGAFCRSFYCNFNSFQIRVKPFVTLSFIWNGLYDVTVLANS